ncbi:MAG: 2-C-methyl-D-erythritol 4-phosphate cytidylyltransferase [Lachnospiraceae bacterium]|nr:2-C-methyl-D-erythritol 4-phosphate cytidylyltransferase [Lachnospiraceae bacterium]
MNVALILSGGTGARMGSDIPKQYLEVGGRPVISYCMETLSLHPMVDALQIVADRSWQRKIKVWLEKADVGKKFRGFSKPGENRQLSVFHGLEDIRTYAEDSGYVFVHDAARPLLSARQITDCLTGVIGRDGLMPVLPMKDTVYSSLDGGKSVAGLLDRSTIYAGQAPEVFRIGRYYEANRKLLPDRIRSINGSTEPAVMDGMDIAMIPGDEGNFKITTKADLERFRRIAGACSEPVIARRKSECRAGQEENQGENDR